MTRLERERQVQRQKSIIYIGCIAFVLVLIILVASRLKGNSLEARASIEGSYVYESILVEDGDTLWSIAHSNQESYKGTVDEYITKIKEINNLSTDSIQAGEYLLLPVYTDSF